MKAKIKLGPAGSPASSTLEGIKVVRKMGLQAMEVEFVRGVKMSNTTAKEVGKVAKAEGIKLSVHAPYYINLNAKEKPKVRASIGRILQSCERGHHLGAKFIVFHPGYYSKMDPEVAYKNIKDAFLKIQATIKRKGWGVKLAPETMGKVNVFGSVEETLRLVKDTKCSCCIDFAHIMARYGKIDYTAILKKFSRIKDLHCHFSGIEFGDKGEKRHLLTPRKEAVELAKAMLKAGVKATIINESPDPMGDTLMTKRVFESLGYKF